MTTSTLLVIVAPERLPSHLLGLSDASDYACSLFISFIDNEQKVVYHNWSPTESSKSSPWRGLKTAVLTLSAFALEHQGKKKKLHWFSDNTSVVSVVHNGSRAVELQSPVLSISFCFCTISGFPLK